MSLVIATQLLRLLGLDYVGKGIKSEVSSQPSVRNVFLSLLMFRSPTNTNFTPTLALNITNTTNRTHTMSSKSNSLTTTSAISKAIEKE